MELISKQNERVYMSTEDEPVTNSLILAKEFDRNHRDVLRAIKGKSRNYSKSFTERNFALSEYRDDTGKMNRMYELTRDGFWAVVFGFTGEKAAKMQELFISEFNRRAEIIRKLQEQIRSENTCALPEPRKEYKHKYSYLQMKATADGFVEHEWVSGAKTIAEMDEIENHARLQHKRASMGLGYYKALIAEMHPRDRYSQEHVDFLETARRLSSHFKPRAYGAKIIHVPIFSMNGVPLIGLDAMNGDHDAAS